MRFRKYIVLTLALFCLGSISHAQEREGVKPTERPLQITVDSDDWQMTDPEAWSLSKGTLNLMQKKSRYQPPVRSPLHIAWYQPEEFGDFQLDVEILSTEKDYNHRDACLFFGYQSPSEFYYVHLGKRTDPHANQIFIVNNAARKKISLTTTEGTPWDDQWHRIRLQRDIETGDIAVYFDNMKEPVMTAKDKSFGKGRIGVGSFDDTAEFKNLVIQD